eukprot:CAMPEP_0119319732 /NCGR_PEP_ID=MMETSP1333-20130426/50174_1 /TAXON_ID=418940 /ORGANISM="Scyphosphaera apsteinii, Strain RCC1455" /LENGTH=90 /DNA_ID=CAMNT_0007326213 /DNA_START=23 /DNA_END=295 /DNA_ORIENTATION=+
MTVAHHSKAARDYQKNLGFAGSMRNMEFSPMPMDVRTIETYNASNNKHNAWIEEKKGVGLKERDMQGELAYLLSKEGHKLTVTNGDNINP